MYIFGVKDTNFYFLFLSFGGISYQILTQQAKKRDFLFFHTFFVLPLR